MERWRVCPECGSDNIHCDIGVKSSSLDSRIANILVYDATLFNLKRASLDIFVCVDCGNIKSFISDGVVLEHIKHKWPRADAIAPGGDAEVRRLIERIEGASEDKEYE